MTVHYGDAPEHSQSLQCAFSGPDFSQDFHTFALTWTPGQLVWYVDGAPRCSQTTGVPAHPLFLIMNSAIGGILGGDIDPAIFPQACLVDYVRIYQ
jgi:beta-glucanase (GH16 family)